MLQQKVCKKTEIEQEKTNMLKTCKKYQYHTHQFATNLLYVSSKTVQTRTTNYVACLYIYTTVANSFSTFTKEFTKEERK